MGGLVIKPVLLTALSKIDDLRWNNVPAGTYYTFSSSSDWDANKHPFANAGALFVYRYGGNSTLEIVIDGNSAVFIRTFLDKWTAWKKL